jgi:hypothetical protein
MTRLSLALILNIAALAGADPFTGLYPLPPQPAALTGNGGLTAGLDASGRLVSCRWPSPGYHGQLGFAGAGKEPDNPAGGCCWGLQTEAGIVSAADSRWERQQTHTDEAPILEIISRDRRSGIQVKQETLVHPEQDVLAIRLTVSGAATAPECAWYQHYAPCTRQLPELPFADYGLDALNGFAAFTDGGFLCHFRPDAPGRDAYTRAETLIREKADATAWMAFPGPDGAPAQGVWIVTVCRHAGLETHCGRAGHDDSAWRRVSGTEMPAPAAVMAPSDSAVRITFFDTGARVWRAEIHTAFARTFAEARTRAETARAKGFEQMRRETASWWHQRFAPFRETVTDPETAARLAPDLRAIFLARDRESGAVVRAPVTGGTEALTRIREAVWIAHALDAAGYPEDAEQLLRFCMDCLRLEPGPGMPSGSLPLAVYTDGRTALPHLLLRPDESAWLLSGLAHHARRRPGQRQALFLDTCREATETAAAFLVRWARINRGTLLPAFSPAEGRDTESFAAVLTAAMGMECAIYSAEVLEEEIPPEWRDRRMELYAILQLNTMNAGAAPPFSENPLLPWWLSKVLEADAPLWNLLLNTNRQPLEKNPAFPASALPEKPARIPLNAFNAALRITAALSG